MLYADFLKQGGQYERKKLGETAIGRYEDGESRKAIHQSLGKSGTWFFKWLKRYQYDGKSGYIHFIRFIRNNPILNVLGEKFPLPRYAEYEYVWAAINTQKQKLLVSHDSKIITTFDYALPKISTDLSKIGL